MQERRTDMNERLKQEAKAYHKLKQAIFPSEMPSSWQITSIIAQHFYDLALEDVRKEVIRKLEEATRILDDAIREDDEVGKQLYFGRRKVLIETRDFIDQLNK